MSFWHAIGEIRMDMSLAVPEDKETTIVLQGLVGDLDLIVPTIMAFKWSFGTCRAISFKQ